MKLNKLFIVIVIAVIFSINTTLCVAAGEKSQNTSSQEKVKYWDKVQQDYDKEQK
ncbi:MAG: hypothetical protein WC394_01695 [Candidatus Omnitrophota bacterium]|jgi:hypothetical protein